MKARLKKLLQKYAPLEPDKYLAELRDLGFPFEVAESRIQSLKLSNTEEDYLLIQTLNQFMDGQLLLTFSDNRHLAGLLDNDIRRDLMFSRGPLSKLFESDFKLWDLVLQYLCGVELTTPALRRVKPMPQTQICKQKQNQLLKLHSKQACLCLEDCEPSLVANVFETKECYQLIGSIQPGELKAIKALDSILIFSDAQTACNLQLESIVDIYLGAPPTSQFQKVYLFDRNELLFSDLDRWSRALERFNIKLPSNDLMKLESVFAVGAEQIEQILTEVMALTDEMSFEAIAPVARKYSKKSLLKFAKRVPARFSWDDLVLPASSVLKLKEIERFIVTRHRRKQYARRHNRGLGVSAVFEGPSGTGKTMSAEVLARSLGLDLYQVNLSKVTSKYIGETEKNISEIFRAAQQTGGVLLFDEGESLFAKRAEVNSSQDKHSNLEVNHLLQELESFDGIVIISTNLGESIDTAFLRRINFQIRFPRPNQQSRKSIWKQHLQKDVEWLGDIDFEFLSKLQLTGGFIKNVVLLASSESSYERRPLEMKDLVHAIKREFQKLNQPIQREVFGDQYWKIASPDWEATLANKKLRALTK